MYFVPHVPPDDPIGRGTELNCTELCGRMLFGPLPGSTGGLAECLRHWTLNGEVAGSRPDLGYGPFSPELSQRMGDRGVGLGLT